MKKWDEWKEEWTRKTEEKREEKEIEDGDTGMKAGGGKGSLARRKRQANKGWE